MSLTDWLSTDQFDWVAGGLAVSLLVASFVMIFVTISSKQKSKQKKH